MRDKSPLLDSSRWYQLSVAEVMQALKVDTSGLASSELWE